MMTTIPVALAALVISQTVHAIEGKSEKLVSFDQLQANGVVTWNESSHQWILNLEKLNKMLKADGKDTVFDSHEVYDQMSRASNTSSNW